MTLHKSSATIADSKQQQQQQVAIALGEKAPLALAATPPSQLVEPKLQAYKNLLVLSFSMLLLFTAVRGVQNLQSTINSTDGLGLASLSVINGLQVVCCVLFPKWIIGAIGCAWGLADGVWMALVDALYGVLFRESKEVAFANRCLWMSLGYLVAFSYSDQLCVTTKVYILIALLLPAMILYLNLDIRYTRWGKDKRQRGSQQTAAASAPATHSVHIQTHKHQVEPPMSDSQSDATKKLLKRRHLCFIFVVMEIYA